MKPDAPVVVAQTADAIEAQIWVDMLRDSGIQSTTFEQSPRGALGGASTLGFRTSHPILVRHHDLVPARNVIAEAGGASHLAPIPAEGEEGGRAARAFVMALTGAALFFALFVVFAVLLR